MQRARWISTGRRSARPSSTDSTATAKASQIAQLSIEGAVFWVQHDIDASPKGRRVESVRMILSVDDPDSMFEQAVAAGAAVVASVHEEHGWRTGRVTDPFGHDWEVSKELS